MKKQFSLILAAALTFSTIHSVSAMTNNRIVNAVTLLSEGTIPSNEVPELILKASEDHTKNFDFALTLNGAQWDYEDNGFIADGISYTKMSDTKLLIFVDVSIFPALTEDIRIPLASKLTEEGDISVTIDPKNSSVTGGTYNYAWLGGKSFTVEVDSVTPFSYGAVSLNDITITDEVPDAYSAGNKFKVTVSTGFTFDKNPTIQTTGKYTNCVAFEVDEENPSTAYITLTKDSAYGVGSIILKELTILPNSNNTKDGDVRVTITRNGISAGIKVAKYQPASSFNTPIKIETFTAGKKPSASGTAAAGKTLMFKVDDTGSETVKVAEDGTWSHTYSSTNLTTGEHTYSVGYYQNGGKWFNIVSETFTVEPQKIYAATELTIGADYYITDGFTFKMDAPAFIGTNKSTMLPVRAVANSVGILDNSIQWDEKTQTATLHTADKIISCTVDKSVLLVNGVPRPIDSPAVIKEGRVYLPLRAILNALGIEDTDITWDDASKTVTYKRVLRVES